jgi:hypothetical protein
MVKKTRLKQKYLAVGGLSPKDAQLVGELVVQIEREIGRVASKQLYNEFVNRSRPPNSRTHHLFEWDLQKGHELYLLSRARKLISCVQIIIEELPEKPVRAFPVVINDGLSAPTPMRRVLDDRDMLLSLITRAKDDLERWKFRYEQLRRVGELKGVFHAIEKATGS